MKTKPSSSGGSNDGVVVEGVVGVVARPAGRHLDAFERRDPVCQHGPHLALPQIGVHGQVVRFDGMVDVGPTAGQVRAAVTAYVHARRVNGEGEWLIEWFGCLEDVGETFARFDGEFEAGHLGYPCCSGPAAFTTVPQEMDAPESRVTPTTRPSRWSMPVTVARW